MTALLPPSSTPLEGAAERLILARLGALGVPLRDLWSAQTCPEALLPWLAWALSIDEWDAAWPLHVRRARVAEAIAIQRIKGTAQSVRDVVALLGGAATLREWWQVDPPATPHTFEVILAVADADGDVPSAAFIDAVIAEIWKTKPVRSHFTFALAVNAAGRIGTIPRGLAIVCASLTAQADPDPAPANTLAFAGWPLTLGGEYLTIGE